MLVLTRKTNERIVIGDGIEITVLKLSGGRVKLGISADSSISIARAEMLDDQEISPAQNDAMSSDSAQQSSTLNLRSA